MKKIFTTPNGDYEVQRDKNEFWVRPVYSEDVFHSGLVAIINNNKEVEYFIEGVYNYNDDYIRIDLEEIQNLKGFCELLISG